MVPQSVLAPANADELAAALAQATADDAGVVPWGAGTRQHLGCAPGRYDLALSTARLDRIVEYSPADLVVTVEADTRLGAVQAALAQHGQWLPWNPPAAGEAGIGGLLASGASGPLRLGYGTPRDWTLGLRVALGDGRLVKSGAKVVKNVAGYDTHKLHLGAFGTLGVIVEATFKVAPLPACRSTVLASFTEPRPAIAALEQLRAAPLGPVSLVALNPTAATAIPSLHHFLQGQPRHLTVAARFAGVQAAVERQMLIATRRCIEFGAHCIDLGEQDDEPMWRGVADFTTYADDETLLLRAGVRPSQEPGMLRAIEHVTRPRDWPAARLFYAGIGLAYARWWPPAATDPAEVAAALSELRAALAPLEGYAVIEQVPALLRPHMDIWGPPPESLALMRRLKAQWDPGGVLNPGRYLV